MSSADRYGELHHTVWAKDHATVPEGLFGIVIILFYDYLLLPHQPRIIVDGAIIERWKNQWNGSYLLALTILNILFQRIPPYSLSTLSQMRRGFPMIWSSGTNPQYLESAELCLLSPIIK